MGGERGEEFGTPKGVTRLRPLNRGKIRRGKGDLTRRTGGGGRGATEFGMK